jgi:hypothetical protein
MKIITFILSLFIVQSSLAQSYTIDEMYIELSGNATDDNFSNNTYFNTLDSCSVSWRIISDSIPEGWLYSNCFPNCYTPGVTSGESIFPTNSQQYLNCHIYPNNIPGEGTIKMEITTNNSSIDTVTWTGTSIDNLSIDSNVKAESSRIKNMYNLEGKKINTFLPNQVFIIEYKNGKTEKRLMHP